MHATNTSSIKSPLVWQATLQPSNLFTALYTCALLLSLVALWHCPVGTPIRCLLMLITLSGGILIYLPTRASSVISFHEDHSWQLVEKHRGCTSGHITSGSYRSMLLVVVAIKPEHGLPRHAIIWRDSVSAVDFSALHIRLALTAANQLS